MLLLGAGVLQQKVLKMYSRSQLKKGSKGSVQFKTTKGRLQIVFSYPVEENGEVKRKRFNISTGKENFLTSTISPIVLGNQFWRSATFRIAKVISADTPSSVCV